MLRILSSLERRPIDEKEHQTQSWSLAKFLIVHVFNTMLDRMSFVKWPLRDRPLAVLVTYT